MYLDLLDKNKIKQKTRPKKNNDHVKNKCTKKIEC